MVLICGIDEAGKGPVMGDLVICGVACMDEKNFDGLGFDSKSLTPKKREELFGKIKEKSSKFSLVSISAKEIDMRNKMGCNLNTLECLKMASIINELNPDIAYIDCPHPVPEKFAKEIKEYLDNKNVKIVAEHRADSSYSIVGAASILAKVTRDAMIDDLKKRFNVDFGSGYPSDPYTRKFIDEFCNGSYQELSEYVRHSWETVKSRMKGKSQQRLV